MATVTVYMNLSLTEYEEEEKKNIQLHGSKMEFQSSQFINL